MLNLRIRHQRAPGREGREETLRITIGFRQFRITKLLANVDFLELRRQGEQYARTVIYV